jgi:hypothetical protein
MDMYCVEYEFSRISRSTVVILERDVVSALNKAHELFPEYERRCKRGEAFPCEYVEVDESGRVIFKRKALKLIVRRGKAKQLPLFGTSIDEK